MLYDLLRTAHTRFLTHIAGVPHVNLNLKFKFAKFLYKAINSQNERITFPTKLCMYNTMSLWMPLMDRMKYRKAVMVFKSLNGLAPQYIKDLFQFVGEVSIMDS